MRLFVVHTTLQHRRVEQAGVDALHKQVHAFIVAERKEKAALYKQHLSTLHKELEFVAHQPQTHSKDAAQHAATHTATSWGEATQAPKHQTPTSKGCTCFHR